MGFDIVIRTPNGKKKKLFYDKRGCTLSDILKYIYNEEIMCEEEYEDVDNPSWDIKLSTMHGNIFISLNGYDDFFKYEY